MKNRLLSLALAVLMVVGMLPTTVWAASTGTVVAKVGDKEYTDLATAVSDAGKTAGNILYVVADAEIGTDVDNGDGNNNFTLVVNENVTLTLFDGATITTGEVTVINNGTIVMEVKGDDTAVDLEDACNYAYVDEYVLIVGADGGKFTTDALEEITKDFTVTKGVTVTVAGDVEVSGSFVAEAGSNIVVDGGSITVKKDSNGKVDLSAAVVSTTVANLEELKEALASELKYNGITVETLAVNEDIVIPSGITVTLPASTTITADGSLTTNGGTIVVPQGGTVTKTVATEEQLVAALADKYITDVTVNTGDVEKPAITVTKDITIPADKDIVDGYGATEYDNITPAAGVTITKEVADKDALDKALDNTNAATLYVRIVKNITDATDVKVPNFKTLEIASGVTLKVTGTLTVDGTLVNNGTIDGVVDMNGSESGSGSVGKENTSITTSLGDSAFTGYTSVKVTYTEGDVNVTDDLEVPAGKTLTIEEGVTVVLDADADLTVKGTLVNNGTIVKTVGQKTDENTTLADALANKYYNTVYVDYDLDVAKSVTVPAGVTLQIGDSDAANTLTVKANAELAVNGEIELAHDDSVVVKEVDDGSELTNALSNKNYNKVVVSDDLTVKNLTVPAEKTLDFNSKTVVITGTYEVKGEVQNASNVNTTGATYTEYVSTANGVTTAFDTNKANNVVVTANVTDGAVVVEKGETLTINKGVTLTVTSITINEGGKLVKNGELALSVASGEVTTATFATNIDRVVVSSEATLDEAVTVESGKTLEIAKDYSTACAITVKNGGALVVNGAELSNATITVEEKGTVTVIHSTKGSIAGTIKPAKEDGTFAYILKVTGDSFTYDDAYTQINLVSDVNAKGEVEAKTVTSDALTVAKDQELVIGEKVTLEVTDSYTNEGKLTNNGKLVVDVTDSSTTETTLNAALANTAVNEVILSNAIATTTGYITVPAGKTLKLDASLTMTKGHVLTNNGTIVIAASQDLNVGNDNGTLVNKGTVVQYVANDGSELEGNTDKSFVNEYVVATDSTTIDAPATLYKGQTLTVKDGVAVNATATLTVKLGATVVLEADLDENKDVATITGSYAVEVDTVSALTDALAEKSAVANVIVAGDIDATDVIVPAGKTLTVNKGVTLTADTLTVKDDTTDVVADGSVVVEGVVEVYEKLTVAAQASVSVVRNATMNVPEGTDTSVIDAAYGAVIGNSTPWVNPFTDVVAGKWYYEAVEYVAKNELMSGMSTTEFGVNTTLSRGMVVTILYRMAGEPEVTGENPFTDVAEGRYYTDAIIWAAANGIAAGYGETFDPEGNVTREQMVSFLARYAKFAGYDMTTTGDLSDFADAADVSNYAVEAMTWAVENGIIKGNGGKILPADTATRAEFAQIVYAFSELG